MVIELKYPYPNSYSLKENRYKYGNTYIQFVSDPFASLPMLIYLIWSGIGVRQQFQSTSVPPHIVYDNYDSAHRGKSGSYSSFFKRT